MIKKRPRTHTHTHIHTHSLFSHPQLTELAAGYNRLTILPPAVGNLHRLTVLDVRFVIPSTPSLLPNTVETLLSTHVELAAEAGCNYAVFMTILWSVVSPYFAYGTYYS